MSVVAESTYDKNVLARRNTPRDVELARMLRATRDRLTSKRGVAPRFDRELLVQHVAVLKSAAIVALASIVVTCFALSAFIGMPAALLWLVLSLLAHATLTLVIRRFQSMGHDEWSLEAWSRLLLAGHMAVGLSWAYFAGLGCDTCEPLRFDIFQFAILLLVIALTAMVSFNLKGTGFGFLPVIAVLVYRMAEDPDPVMLAMRGVLIVAVPFFMMVSDQLRRNALDRLKHQAEKDELIAELETARIVSDEARRRAEEANLAKSRFLATMSHELRTPLNAILGFSEVISNEILGPIGNPTYGEYVRDIHNSGRHLLNVINEILDLSRIEAGRYTLNEEAIDLVGIAKDCISYIQLKAQAKSISLVSQFERDLPNLWADERAVRQVILNLLSNAVKFTPNGGEVVVRVGWTAGGGEYVSVHDNGPGIPEDEIPVVMSSFGQGSAAIKSAEQGTGLGLPIVQALVQMHDGVFRLQSKLREGTEVIAIFPCTRVLEIMPAMATAS
ncbi:sensor histidine kinase [Consotaella aegiceratis]|uniref:sensor histidine kinase n=1 Tax=Consotaella aegiceratis TaxID=3097961 RepID=UPI002F404EE2